MSDPISEEQAVALLVPWSEARAKKADADKVDRRVSPLLRTFLESQPEGERELWDGEHNVGAALDDGGAGRWVDFSALSDADIVTAARMDPSLFRLDAGAFDEFVEAGTEDDIEGQQFYIRLLRAVHNGGGTRLVRLPRKG